MKDRNTSIESLLFIRTVKVWKILFRADEQRFMSLLLCLYRTQENNENRLLEHFNVITKEGKMMEYLISSELSI